MNWITWTNANGNRTTRAHAASNCLANRTECGWPIGELIARAPMSMPKCRTCVEAELRQRRAQRYMEQTGQGNTPEYHKLFSV